MASPIATPPDGGYGWCIVAASFGCNLIFDGITYSFGVLLPHISDYYDEPTAKVSLMGSLCSGLFLLVAPLSGGLVNRLGCRLVTVIGSAISCLMFVISTFCTSLDWLILVYGVIGGIGFGLIYLPSIVIVGYYFEKRRALASGLALGGASTGMFVMSTLMEYLLSVYDWRGTFYILAGCIFNCAVLGALMRPLKLPENSEKIKIPETDNEVNTDIPTSDNDLEKANFIKNIVTCPKDPTDNDPNHESKTTLLKTQGLYDSVVSIKGQNLETLPHHGGSMHLYASGQLYASQILTTQTVKIANKNAEKSCQNPILSALAGILDLKLCKSGFLVLFLGNFFSFAGLYIPNIYLPDRAVYYGVDRRSAAFLIAIYGIANVVGRVLSGCLANLPRVRALYVNNVCLIVCSLSTLVLPLFTGYIGMCVYSSVFGLFIAGHIATTPVILCDLLGIQALTSSFGMLTFFRGAATIAGAPIAGALYDLTRDYDFSFYFGGGCLFLASLLHILLVLPVFTEKWKIVVDKN